MKSLARRGGVGKKMRSKTWFTIVAPPYFKEKQLGLTPAADPKQVLGRVVEASAMDLTNDFSKYYIKFRFRVTSVEGERAYTSFYGLECLRDYISRLIRKRSTRIDAIQDLVTKDGVPIRVKSLAVTFKKVKSSVEKAIRDEIKKIVEEEVKGSTLQQFLDRILNNSLKKKVMERVSEIYPLRHFEVRKIDVLSKERKKTRTKKIEEEKAEGEPENSAA